MAERHDSALKSITVNGETLLESEVRARASAMRLEREAAGYELTLEERFALRGEARQLAVDRILLLQEARRLQLLPSAQEIDTALAQLARRFDGLAGCRAGADNPESRQETAERLMIDKLVATWRNAVKPPDPKKARDYYKLNRQQFVRPPAVHASHVVRNFQPETSEDHTREAVEALRERIANGEDFASIATQASDCPEHGGDIGWFHRDVMVSEFDNAVFSAPVGKLTPVFRTQFGFHFALVHERKEEGAIPFDDVRQHIEDALWLSKQDTEVGRKLEELRSKADIRSGS